MFGESNGRAGKVSYIESVQSIIRTLGMELEVVCALDRVGSGESGGERSSEKSVLEDLKTKSRMGVRVNVKPLCRGWPAEGFVSHCKVSSPWERS